MNTPYRYTTASEAATDYDSKRRKDVAAAERDAIIAYIETYRADPLRSELDFWQVARNLIIDLRANKHHER